MCQDYVSNMAIFVRERISVIFLVCLCGISKANGECANCASETCLPNQTCNGCKEGVYGLTCNQSCSHLCLSCVQDFDVNKVCLTCKPGTYGPTCQHKCRIGCATCTSEYQCQDCELGYRKSGLSSCKCDNKCENCKSNGTFGSKFTCAKCVQGRYGIFCQNLCPSHCKFCTSNSSCVVCPSGYGGQLCDIKCLPHCSICDFKRHCSVCEPGWYTSHDHNLMSPTTFYCNLMCSTGCRDKACEMWSGQCDCKSDYFTDDQCSICVIGKYGDDCALDCSTDCLNGGCRRSDGRCNSCSKGRYGDQCERTCRDTCVDRECDRDGRCTYGCEQGYFGQRCQLQCSTGCKDSSCLRNEGLCSYGCKKDFFGHFCETGLEENNVLLYVVVVFVALVVVFLVVETLLTLIIRCRKTDPNASVGFDNAAMIDMHRSKTPETRGYEINRMSRHATSDEIYTELDE